MNLVDDMRDRMKDWTLGNQMQGVIDDSRLADHYAKEPQERMETRMENLRELANAADAFVIPQEDADAGLTELQSFLSHAALEAGDTQGENWEDCVQMMTLHSAKGLEFPQVFIGGMEDGLFPHQRSVEDSGGRLEEERRLCYVGMTRAREQLCLCYAEVRRMFGQENFCRPSRFIDEMPAELLEEVRPSIGANRQYRPAKPSAAFSSPSAATPFKLGQGVFHQKFGEGTVLAFEGSGDNVRVHVNFLNAGAKWLVLAYAKLEAL
jgi:DNA helicase-2/ATP-dependent DNA helicase PcrA